MSEHIKYHIKSYTLDLEKCCAFLTFLIHFQHYNKKKEPLSSLKVEWEKNMYNVGGVVYFTPGFHSTLQEK